MIDDHTQRILDRYAHLTDDQLNDELDKAKEAIRKAEAVYMRHYLASDKDARETASMRFYNIQLALRYRGTKQ
jgi:hypothetical protein